MNTRTRTITRKPILIPIQMPPTKKEANAIKAEARKGFQKEKKQPTILVARIVGIADRLKANIPPFNGQAYLDANDAIDYEINNYFSIEAVTNPRDRSKFIGVLKQNSYNQDQKNKIKTAIAYYRSIPEDNPIKSLINSYQSDPDADDMLRADKYDRRRLEMEANYKLLRYFNLDPARPFLSQQFRLSKIDLGVAVDELMNEEDPDDRFDPGYIRFNNILTDGLRNLVLMALVFPSWPNFTPPFSLAEEPRISVYIGTGHSTSGEANCLNFKLQEIDNGSIRSGDIIDVYAPVTSASNDANVAIRFAKSSGSIIKINLANGKSFMCVSTSPNEAETFVLAGQYQYIRQYPFEDQLKGAMMVYEFNQLNTDFTGLTSANVTQIYWDSLKEQIGNEIRTSLPSLDPKNQNQSSIEYSSTMDRGGSSKTNKRRTNRHKTNKRQTKRRTNKRKLNKRKTKRRI